MNLFSLLGFHWDRSAVPIEVATHSVERVAFRFHRMLPEFVWDASMLEGNPFTFPEVKTLLEGVTIGGRKISDHEAVLNLASGSKHLLALVNDGSFSLDKATFTDLHDLVARSKALERGHFRGEGNETNYTPDVGLGEHGRYTPLATIAGAPELNRVFASGLQALQGEVQQPFEKAAAFFLFGALQQFFFDGNKRASHLMMNGILMSAGVDAISVPAAKAQEFNEKMGRFYRSKDACEMMSFLTGCHPDAGSILPPVADHLGMKFPNDSADADQLMPGVVNTVVLDDKRRIPSFPLRLTERELAELKNIAATKPDSMHQFCVRAIREAMRLS